MEETQTRKQKWNSLAETPINTTADLYQVAKPADGSINPNNQKNIGIGQAFVRGLPSDQQSSLPYNPDYKPTFGESMAAGVTDFIRSGVKVGMELFDPETKAARQGLSDLRRTDPNAADEIETLTIGKQLSGKQLAVKGAAAVGEGVLTFLPFFKVGKAALVAKESFELSKLGGVGKAIKASDTLSKLYSGGTNGVLYGGLYGLHEYDADWSEAAKTAAFGGVAGMGMMGMAKSLGVVGKFAGDKTMAGLGKAGGVVAKGAEYVDKNFLQKVFTPKVYSAIFSVESTMKKYYGEIGENFTKMYREAARMAVARGDDDPLLGLGQIQDKMIKHGLLEAPKGMEKVAAGVEFVGKNPELMAHYNQVLRGLGAYSDPVARTAAINADARLTFLDELRKTYGATAQREGVVNNLLDLDTYLPKHTPVVELSQKIAKKLATATNQAEREAIYASNDPVVKEMVENSVLYEKKYPTLEDAYASYYAYADAVKNGGKHSPVGDNKFLREMVANGEAKNVDEAMGKIIADLKYRKKSLTPMASSLDFERKANLPWYDPNPSRVMPQYTFDASMRIEMAKKFGANDEKIHEMIGKIKKDFSTHGANAERAAVIFEDFVRTVTGQVDRAPELEKASALIRALQVPKLAFAQIPNLGQSLNTLLASDFGATMFGLTKAFTTEEMNKAIERGVLTNSFIRQIFDYNSGGSQLAEKFLRWTGFTYTEMFNRAVGSTASDKWGESNLRALAKKYGFEFVEGKSQEGAMKLLAEKGKKNKASLMGGVKVQKEAYDKFKQLFPDENFNASAGNIDAATSRYDTLEANAERVTGKLQATKEVLEKELISETEQMDASALYDLQNKIDALKVELFEEGGGGGGAKAKKPAAPEIEYTEEQTQAARDFSVALKRAKLEDVIARLQSKIEEAKAAGAGEKVVTMRDEAARTPETLEHYVTKIHQEIKNLDDAIVGVQNELADKSRLLESVMDSYKISEERAAKAFPGGAEYDKYMESRKGATASALEKIKKDSPREYYALKELGIPVDDVISRGFMTPQEKALAAQTFVEHTQFMGQPLDLPYFASHPMGKVLFQFKTFAYQQARFINKELKTQFERKDYGRAARNLVILSTVFPMTGEVLSDIRSLITQEKRPTPGLDRYFADIFAAGTYGMYYDFWKSAEAGNTAEFALGASAGDVMRYIENAFQAPGQIASGHGGTALKTFTKNILRQTGIGRPISNVMFPSQTQKGKSTAQELLDWSAE